MKVLSFEFLFFKLPDDFEGGLGAALRDFADYHDSVAGTAKQVIGAKASTLNDLTVVESREKIWDEFWTMICSEERCVCGVSGLHEYTDDPEVSYDLDLNTGVRTDD